MANKIRDLTGQTFSKLAVVSFAGSDKWARSTWLCKCECGNEKTVAGNSITEQAIKNPTSNN